MTASDIVFIHEVERQKVDLWRVRVTLLRSDTLSPQVRIVLDDALKLAYDVLTDATSQCKDL